MDISVFVNTGQYSQHPNHLYSKMMVRAKKCLSFQSFCVHVCHSLPMCGLLFTQEINGSLARCLNTSAEEPAVCVCVWEPSLLYSALLCYFCQFLFSLSTGWIRGSGSLEAECDRLGFSVHLNFPFSKSYCSWLSLNNLFVMFSDWTYRSEFIESWFQ